MRIGMLLPSLLASQSSLSHRIFAPLFPTNDLVNGLIKKGHEVFFYTAPDVKTNATVIGGNETLLNDTLSYYQFRNRDPLEKKYTTTEVIKRDYENELTMEAYVAAMHGKLDIIHSHVFAPHYMDRVTKFPTIYTLHDILPQTAGTIEYERLKLFQDQNYVSISMSQRKSIIPLNFVANIYHGIDVGAYPFSSQSEDGLIFIGRLLPGKGTDVALLAAKELHKTLRIATSPDIANTNKEYFAEKIQPYIDGNHAVIDGFLHGKEKAAFYGKGKALLFPIQWEEPFGLVMIESMSCGTPVIAFARGSVPEVVVDGETGFLVNPSDEDIRGEFVIKTTGVAGFKEAIERLYSLSENEYLQMRKNARERVEKHFTVEKMVDQYEKLYQSLIK